MKLGSEVLLEKHAGKLKGKRLGLLAHPASRDSSGLHIYDKLFTSSEWKVAALFGPEHGIDAMAEDMEAVDSLADPKTGTPIYSLYGSTYESLKPTKAMLDKIDLLVVDLQDVGARYYTYVWTAVLCMQACAACDKRVIVCDRPNPIGGELVDGGGIESGFESFVGLHSIPVRHGMTIGEIARMIGARLGIERFLEVVPMKGWRRDMKWADTGLAWINPSPNMRSYNAALLYPGMCLVEGTNVSEGRGTDTPFEIIGAPYVDTDELIDGFEEFGLPGVHVAPTSFFPESRKWARQQCNGVRWIVSDEEEFRPYLTGLAFIWLVNRLYKGKGFEWNHSPYEFVTERPAIDLLTGSDAFRRQIDELDLSDIKSLTRSQKGLISERKKALIY